MSAVRRYRGLPGFLVRRRRAFLVDGLLAVLAAGIAGGLGTGLFFLLDVTAGMRGIIAFLIVSAVILAAPIAILVGCAVLFFAGTILQESYHEYISEWRARPHVESPAATAVRTP